MSQGGILTEVVTVGPSTSTNNAIARWDGTSGNFLKDSTVIVSDTGDMTGIGNISMSGSLTVGGLVDGRDIAVDGAKLDTIETSADVTDYDNVSAAGAIMNTIMLAKGNILTASGAGTPAVLAPGVSGYVLTASSAQPYGIMWAPSAPGGFTWNIVTSADNPITLADKTGYIVKGALQVVFILPAGAAAGLNFRIIGYGNLWTITQNAGQSMVLGVKTSTVGALGSFTATMVTDTIEMVCVTANTEFYTTSVVGNITIV